LIGIGYILVEGIHYDLSHLRDARYNFVLKKSGRHTELRFMALVQCRSHCACRGPKVGEDLDFSAAGGEPRIIDEKGDDRVFDKTRWSLSHLISSIMATLLDRRCVLVSRSTWLTTEIVEVEGEHREYEIYFRVTKLSRRLVRISVVSAYVRSPGYASGKRPHPKRRSHLLGKVLLARTLLGKPIR